MHKIAAAIADRSPDIVEKQPEILAHHFTQAGMVGEAVASWRRAAEQAVGRFAHRDNVEIKHVDLNESMIRAIARQAEAERNRRARIINAEGEQQAAEKLVEAASILATRPEAMQLRYLNTVHDIAGERSSTIVFPVPIDLLHGLLKTADSNTSTPAR